MHWSLSWCLRDRLQNLNPEVQMMFTAVLVVLEFWLFWSPADTLVQSETYNLTGSSSGVVEDALLSLNQDIDH